jgi:hypothetical protein
MLAVRHSFDTSAGSYRTNIINLLLSKNADVNLKDNDGETAMFQGK